MTETTRTATLTLRETWPNMAIEDGIQLMESTLNYDYASPKQDLGNFEEYETTATIELASEGILSGTSMTQVYNTLLAWVGEEMGEGEEMYFTDLNITESGPNGVTISSFGVVGGIVNPLLDCGNVALIDDWKAGKLLGRCDFTDQGKDAAARIGEIVSCAQPCAEGWSYFDEFHLGIMNAGCDYGLYSARLAGNCIEKSQIHHDVYVVENEVIPNICWNCTPEHQFLYCDLFGSETCTGFNPWTPSGVFWFGVCNPLAD